MSAAIRVIYVGDVESQQLDRPELSGNVDLRCIRDPAAAVEEVRDRDVDLVVADVDLPGETIVELTDGLGTVPIVTAPKSELVETIEAFAAREAARSDVPIRYLESLHDATETLLHATSLEEAAEVAVDALADGLDPQLMGIWLLDQNEDELVPRAVSRRTTGSLEDVPSFPSDESNIAWRAFREQERFVIDNVQNASERLGSETELGSVVVVPLSEFGVLMIGADQTGAFTPEKVTVVELWAATVTMVLVRVQREQLLREREAEARRERDRLDDFASIMSHDLRNPLTVANGYLEFAAAEVDSPHLLRVEQALERMESLIDDMLTLAREGWQACDPEPVDLEATARKAWGVVGREEGSLTVTSSGTIGADPSQLSQVLENLFANAQKHTPGPVSVEVGTLPDGFYVEDDGPGIDPADRDEVFEMGHTTSEDGTGFGLAIVNAVVEAHGWDLELTESEAGGARFEFREVTTH